MTVTYQSQFRLHNKDYRCWSWWRWINVKTQRQPRLYWMKPPGEKGNIGIPFSSTTYLTPLFTGLDPNMWIRLLFWKTQNKPWCRVMRMKMQHGAKIKPTLLENVHTQAKYIWVQDWELSSRAEDKHNDLWNVLVLQNRLQTNQTKDLFGEMDFCFDFCLLRTANVSLSILAFPPSCSSWFSIKNRCTYLHIFALEPWLRCSSSVSLVSRQVI